ncbi:alpha-ketoglutarate-dependent dioxygenase AlkB [Flavobacterium sp. MAH-1]|uniref:Alpha-ketoglutarate-dependent dioxygenase AlkB n=1 Tax=Flavobacterium agri TaxID=2743471 RepID=A0A7Y8Y4H9_9FLAO|nr:alpha-ketoglutarate-dependent dioxygenase AlkB [Flavobacterium agri]NUY82434.1 alpha-ketoglutarate-dependent dioxygenase AlkB [Flavobacterium agri]NYA72458.1 alpha-ketoglutarate-dependent dioxygenase AlkB [Flavobacterium agri]
MENLLPKDGVANYYGKVIPNPDVYFEALLRTIDWKNDEVVIFGKRIVTKRETAWYGDKPFEYTYSKTTKTALPWTSELLELKRSCEEISGETYNSCLLNLYHDGSESMGWHSDDEPEIEKEWAIASVSLGAERKFSFKHKKDNETVSLLLENGSLLVMKGKTQQNWQHAIPKSMKVMDARINLTFRKLVDV